LHFAGEQSPREGAERVNHVVRMLVQGRLVETTDMLLTRITEKLATT
jgi:hypothetical protein